MVNEIAKDLLLDRTCDNCVYYYANYYGGSDDGIAYCHCKDNELGPEIPSEMICAWWAKNA